MTTATSVEARDDINVTIGYNAHALLFQQRRRQKEMAAAMGLSSSVLGKKLHGDSAWLAVQIQAAADFLGVEPGRLFRQVTVA